MPESLNYNKAVLDFREARRKADLQSIIARLGGESNELLSYEAVRKTLNAVEGNKKKLIEIPLDSIVGSLGRYSDFTRDFLPRRDSDLFRWASVMEKTIDLEGLPPIEVYQIGEVYFVKDGNHRVSVARQLEASHIQAYVKEVRSRVPIKPDIQPDQLIIVAEHLNFIEQTKIDKLRPGADLTVTIPGQYPVLEEHISVHQYFMGIEQQRTIEYEEAVTHWYDHVYLPVVKIIRERGILDQFPNRTETDLYLWISRHGGELQESLGWNINTAEIADDLVYSYSQDLTRNINKIANRILDIMIPDPLESGPPTGHWRRKYVESKQNECDCLFEKIIVALGEDTNQWDALDQAIIIAQKEDAQLRGLHVVDTPETVSKPYINKLKSEFAKRCDASQVTGELALDVGGIARKICDRAHWADLVVGLLAHPPGDSPIGRLGSGFRTMIRRCPRPVLGVPCQVTNFNHALLAYTNSPKAIEAMYIAAFVAGKWNTRLTVLTIDQESDKAEDIQASARGYLTKMNLTADYVCKPSGAYADIILDTAHQKGCDFLLMGGYKATPLVEVVVGSIVDQALRDTTIPVLVCR